LINKTIICKKIVDIAIKTLINRLEKNKWLSSETKNKSIQKIKKIKIYIGCKPKMDDDINIDYSQNMFDNYIKWNNAVLNNSLLKLHDDISPDTHYLGNMNCYDVNASYSQVDNSIFIPFGILQPPFLTNNFIHTMAFLGIIICHELIHALDDEGAKYDENGVFKDWWKKSDKEKYKKITSQVLNLYKQYSNNDHKTEDLKVGENIADLSSMNIVEDILEKFLTEHKEKQFKQFYAYYAKLYRNQNYKTYYEIVKNDYHSYGKYRINCILSNSERFRKYFNISSDDKMYHTIINIW
jgi:putative endopeptidase